MAPATEPRYTRREARGQIEQVNDDGVRIAGEWWNQSRRQPVSLAGYRVGDLVQVAASQTADGQRRFLLEIAPAGPQRQAPPAYVDDMPDWPDDDISPDPALRQAQGKLCRACSVTLVDGESGACARCTAAARPDADRERIADRLACLQIAAGVLTPWWVKKSADPDAAILIGVADQLVGWLHDTDRDDA